MSDVKSDIPWRELPGPRLIKACRARAPANIQVAKQGASGEASADCFINADIIQYSTTATLEKTGSGVLQLVGNNRHGATAVSAGTLWVDGTQSGQVAVNAGAVLKGSGTVGRILMTTPPKPELYIERIAAASVRLRWTTNAVGYGLQSNTNLGNWQLLTTPLPVRTGSDFVVTNSATNASRFYRLQKP